MPGSRPLPSLGFVCYPLLLYDALEPSGRTRDVDMKRKVDSSSLIQSRPPLPQSLPSGGKNERGRKREESCAGLSRGAVRGAAG
ncbi:hypothetical protein LEMLEM_LOCUS12976 [Lemmus lemmus]